MAARLTLKEDYEALVDKYDTWLFDCDGVLWEGDQLVDGITEVLDFLRSKSAYQLFIVHRSCGPILTTSIQHATREGCFIRHEQCH